VDRFARLAGDMSATSLHAYAIAALSETLATVRYEQEMAKRQYDQARTDAAVYVERINEARKDCEALAERQADLAASLALLGGEIS